VADRQTDGQRGSSRVRAAIAPLGNADAHHGQAPSPRLPSSKIKSSLSRHPPQNRLSWHSLSWHGPSGPSNRGNHLKTTSHLDTPTRRPPQPPAYPGNPPIWAYNNEVSASTRPFGLSKRGICPNPPIWAIQLRYPPQPAKSLDFPIEASTSQAEPTATKPGDQAPFTTIKQTNIPFPDPALANTSSKGPHRRHKRRNQYISVQNCPQSKSNHNKTVNITFVSTDAHGTTTPTNYIYNFKRTCINMQLSDIFTYQNLNR
jgi:hypothetical protein